MVFSKMGKMLALVVVAAAFAGCQQQQQQPSADVGADQTGGMTAWGCPNTVYFDFDKSDIKSEFQDCLMKGGAYLKEHADAKLTIEGHCDERGTPEYNMALGERRAQAVIDVLVTNGGMASQVEAVSYGEERPAADGHDESAWSQNRRAVITGK